MSPAQESPLGSCEGPARVLIVEDDRLVALDLGSMLVEFGFVPCATAHSAEAAIELARQCAPDLVLMDIRLEGELDGVDAAKQLLETRGLRVVYLTANSDRVTVERAKQTQPLGYVLKPVRPRDLQVALELAIHQVRAERAARAEPSTWTEVDVDAATPHDVAAGLSGLSARELEVLVMIARGLTSKDVANKLGIAKPTVDTYRRRLGEKLSAKSRAELVVIAARAGLLQTND